MVRFLPDYVKPYKQTPVFTETTIPDGLLNIHQTKAHVWGKIVVLEGELLYRCLEPDISEELLSADHAGIVEPACKHQVMPQGNVKFYVEFYQ